jgi:3-oxoacyl-[acyl-carrier protein] reductase
MERRFVDKVVVVTGSTRHIGRGIAHRFAREGAKVVINGIEEPSNIEAVVEEVRREGAEVVGVRADVSRAEEVDHLFATIRETWGRVDVLVNNAGLVRTRGFFLETNEEEWERIIGVNLKGVLLCSHRAARIMAQQGGGAIINISSVGAVRAHLFNVVYDATKAAVEGLTRAMAADLGPLGIRVNAIGPGGIPYTREPEALRTHRLPLQRWGTPEDIAAAVAFLASEDAAYITGQVFYVDGGLVHTLDPLPPPDSPAGEVWRRARESD